MSPPDEIKMDFLEEEAEVSDQESGSGSDAEVSRKGSHHSGSGSGSGSDAGSGSDDEDSGSKVKKKKKDKKKKKAMTISDDEDDEEEEEDDEEKIRQEMADFIDEGNEEEEEGDDSGDESGGEKRKHEDSEEDDDELEDDDLALIEENLGIKVKRPPKKLKRIRVVSDDEDSDKEEGEQSDRKAIAEELFTDAEDEGEEHAETVKDTQDTEMDLEGSEEEDELDNFIVDDDGQPIKKTKKKKHIIHSDSALQEAQDIFGVDFDFEEFENYDDEEEEDEDFEEEYAPEEGDEESEGRQRTKKAGRKKGAKKGIFDVFEPVELERGFFTDLDNEIRTTDMPERFQLRQIPVKPTEDGELEEEAEWIYKQAFATPTISVQGYLEQESHTNFGRRGPSMINKIREAINFMRNQHFEVPFIAFYRKEYVESDLNINDLWKVWEWDEKWTQLRIRKQNTVRLFEKMQNYQFETNSDPDKVLESNVRPLTDEDVDKVKQCQTLDELRDSYQHFLLYYGADIPKMRNAEKAQKKSEEETEHGPDDQPEQQEMIKQATRKTGYTICQSNKLDDIAQKMGLTPEHFGENLRDNYQRHEVEQYPIDPLELAKEFCCSQFQTEEDVLLGARHMVAMQIAHDPLVRQCVRQAYIERAKIKIYPTKKGVKEIDESHACYPVKYVKNKPVKDLRDDMFLKLHMAEEEGLITMGITIDEESENIPTYFEEVRQLYHRDEFSHLVNQWNLQRSQAVERALVKILYPQMEKEVRAKLLQEAKDGIIKACCRKLYNWLKVAPYQADQQVEHDYDYDEKEGLRVLGIAYSTDRLRDSDVAGFGALIDGEGQVRDFLRLVYLTKRRNVWRQADREGKEKDLERLKEFISTKKPHVVAVSAESRDALMIVDDIKSVIEELCQEQQMTPIHVELVDNELAMVYENSNKAQAEFREYPVVLRHAVSIARRLQDPLIEFAQLCNPDEDIMCLKYHPLQSEVPKEHLMNALSLEFVNRVNEVGVDVNQAIQCPHTAPLVQFVCGLGPRKGSHLLKILKQNSSRLENRTQLVTLCHMGPKVFINCAGFIKIDTNGIVESTESYVEVLDGSRVHPETYEWARKMAVDALEYDDTAEDANPAGALEEILESPERLKILI
ncbi:hypothetical protein KUTeg_010058 [Tegillarca granosa]|uniref:YqgF/RNase H-like domain-containing protein n=1 Tax=Tegillarca granosa TaxID=220873 RepID=A0ABQ9F8R1_TEGGR|nr:hypothetical protein KUTeg_010058 [Tegillarca granosa]